MTEDNATLQLLDAVAFALSDTRRPVSDYRLSQELGVSRQRVSQWRRGMSGIGSENCIDLCEIAWPGDVGKKAFWLARLSEDREHSEKAKSVWRQMADKVAMLALPLALAVGLAGAPAPAQASAVAGGDLYYVKFMHLHHCN